MGGGEGATQLRIWICVAGTMVASIAGAMAFLNWPLAPASGQDLPRGVSRACGSALDRGPAYDVLRGRGTFVFLTRPEYQVIRECDALRARNRWTGVGLATGAVVVLAAAATIARRRAAS